MTTNAEAGEIGALAHAVRSHDAGAIARAITLVERGDSRAEALLAALAEPQRDDEGFVIGITGAPGSGKSTLVGALAKHLRARNERVAILAIDPSSSLGHGALLGDRVRMGELSLDDDVFIRSMAARGALGGLSAATRDALSILQRADFDTVLVETVGVGQSEDDVVSLSDCVVLVHAPNAGDEVQAIKAGLNELANVHVLNKSDLAGAEKTWRLLEEEVHYRAGASRSRPLVATVATRDEGLDELVAAIDEQRRGRAPALRADTQLRARRAVLAEIERLATRLFEDDGSLIEATASGEIQAREAARRALAQLRDER